MEPEAREMETRPLANHIIIDEKEIFIDEVAVTRYKKEIIRFYDSLSNAELDFMMVFHLLEKKGKSK